MSQINACCAECGVVGGVSLKVCKTCMGVKYCNAACQKNHWPTHKKECKLRAAELRDEALFKDPPAKEDCPICFLPMPVMLICCVSLPSATTSSVPIDDFANANTELTGLFMEEFYTCCGKSICKGCVHSFSKTGNDGKCPFCKSDRSSKSDGELLEELMKRVEANDAASNFVLAIQYQYGRLGLQQDNAKAMELYVRAAELGLSKAHSCLGDIYRDRGDLKKAKFHLEAAAMAGHEAARYRLGEIDLTNYEVERAFKHLTIAASAGSFRAMHILQLGFENGVISRKSIDSTLTAYNSSCAEMRSEARDAYIRALTETI
jgi:tetratricopeptide (TPR) repeat protein